MTSPARYLTRMILFIAVIGAGCAALYQPLEAAYMGNPVINGIIVAAFAIGVLFSFRQTLRLLPEHRWLKSASRGRAATRRLPTPSLLAPVAVILKDKDARVSPQILRSMLEGVAIRLDESREISRYMIGLLIFLGLLGTFWGLLATVQNVGGIINSIDTEAVSTELLMGQIREGLAAPLDGMATAFSSSLFGLAGSLVLGFLDLQFGQASGRFYTDVEDWLGNSVLVKNRMLSDASADAEMSPMLSEAAAEALQELARTIAADESDRRDLAESLGRIEVALNALARETRTERSDLKSSLTIELRALGKVLARDGRAGAERTATGKKKKGAE